MTRSMNVLLVEDNPADAKMTKRAFEQSEGKNRLNIVTDGEQALNYLNRSGQYSNSDRPDLILLDLNIPKLPGIELLKKIKENDDLKSIPVIILSTSSAERDIVSSYNLHANSFITKPDDLGGLVRVTKAINNFWFDAASLP